MFQRERCPGCDDKVQCSVVRRQTAVGRVRHHRQMEERNLWQVITHFYKLITILLHRFLDILLYRFLPVFGTVDTGKGWHSQDCPRAIGGINTCHKMRHSLFLPIVTYICMREFPHFHHGPTTSFLHSQPIQTPPSGPGLIYCNHVYPRHQLL